MPNVPSSPTPSLDLPPELMQIMNMGAPGINPMAPIAGPGGPMAPENRPTPNERVINPLLSGAPAGGGGGPVLSAFGQPGYADGGMVGPNGMPMPQQPMPQQPMPQQQMGGQPGMAQPAAGGQQVTEADIQQFVQQNPQAVQQIAGQLQQMVQSGELAPQGLQMAGQLAQVALNNPDMYPQMRQFAIQQGLMAPEEIPEQFDPGLLAIVLIAARSLEGAGAMGGTNGMGGADEMPSYADGGLVKPGDNASGGGKVRGPGTSTSDSIPIRVSTGEYVIPAHVVSAKGREFFDKMLDSYRER